MRRRGIPIVAAVVATWLLGSPTASAQDVCAPGDDTCLPPPPCYREPDDPECNPDCTCDSPDYPECDPYCSPGDTCAPDCGNPCWDEFEGDVCSDDRDACEPGEDRPFEFIDDMDGEDDGEIYAFAEGDPAESCGTIRVDETGYYAIFDTELAESCSSQMDETGYLTIENSCNADGWAVERNAGDRYLVFDSDNTAACIDGSDCGAGEVCRTGYGSTCCTPDEPVFMGTFLLVAGEDNRICLHHWCPEWDSEMAGGTDYGFVVDGCEGINSIHFRIGTTALACKDETTFPECFGCMTGECGDDPCDSAACPSYCKDGVCLDDNPCADLDCEHGCKNGYCLQNRHARGPDADGDGYSEVADCDDMDPDAHPDQPETCDDGVDDNCDGFVDERPCDGAADGGTAGDDGGRGPDGSADAGRPGGTTSDCTCGVASPRHAAGTAAAIVLVLAGLSSRRRRRQ